MNDYNTGFLLNKYNSSAGRANPSKSSLVEELSAGSGSLTVGSGDGFDFLEGFFNVGHSC